MKKELIVFCVSQQAYFLPRKLAKLAREADILYEKTRNTEAYEFIQEIRKKYKPIPIFHLFTGDIS